jgi:hypothetical protein
VAEVLCLDAEDFGDALARSVDAGQHWEAGSLDLVEEHGLAVLRGRDVRDRGELVLRIDLAADVQEIAPGIQDCHEIAHLKSPCGAATRLVATAAN